MAYVAKIRNVVRSFSLEAALLSTLALPPFVLFGNFADHAEPGLKTESISRKVSISDGASFIVTMSVNVKNLEPARALHSVQQR